MTKKSNNNQIDSSIPSGRQFVDMTARRISKQRFIPDFIRKHILGLSKNNSKIQDNRRKKITPELQAYIQKIDRNKITKRERLDIQELAHYAYIFDISYYKNQLPKEESEHIHSTGDSLYHYCTKGWKEGIDPSHLFAVSYTHLTLPTKA